MSAGSAMWARRGRTLPATCLVLLLLPLATGWVEEASTSSQWEPTPPAVQWEPPGAPLPRQPAAPPPPPPQFAELPPPALLAAVGADVLLDCRVHNLAEKSVSWIRSRDLQILSHGGAVFTADARVSSAVTRDASGDATGDTTGDVTRHTLTIRKLRRSDAGRYECQVNTEPKMSLFFNLTVLDALPAVSVSVSGGGAAAAGSRVALRCVARYDAASSPPGDAAPAQLEPLWFKDDIPITFQSVGGGVSIVSERWAGGARSALTLAAAAARDAGTYTCRLRLPSPAGSHAYAHTQLHILHPAAPALEAMQRDEASSLEAGGAAAAAARLSRLLAAAAAAAALLTR